ncbi:MULTISPECIES: ATP-binding protein [unclassified Streptomyces]|uniref:ATP-binding protein n=1 Tax=unclassified Streptomyces TaxID=2593676 RepID=UPI002365AE78|nr:MULTISPECIES: ATP-binding protein [unclassified Streptomyces]MDF3141660.1 ATP-binding protein [Streptomyces sp. T21Q-yed]WDF39131.1 ATP-binding protein [Streptomyces sp. T12]
MNQETAAPTPPLTQLDNHIRNFSVQLSPTPRGARLARLLATEQLRSWGLPLDRAAHVVAELAANAVTHGRIPGRDFLLLLYVVGDTVRIEVTDTCGDRLPHPQPPAPEAESGRGLLLVEAFADRWGFTEGPAPRKTVWAEVTLPPIPGNPRSGGSSGLPQETRR